MSAAVAQPGETKELRLVVVCYGGVSLAIYMHGTTKELHRLVKASALLGRHADDAAYGPSERVYHNLLQDLKNLHPDKVRTRVVVDIISGTSAGGINGVYLAKALAHNRSQDALRDLWLDKGDIGTIMCGWKRIPWKARAPWLLLRARRKAPLHGDRMSVWLYDALQDMDKERKPADVLTLMPPGHLLELYVTTTDFYGYNRSVTLAGRRPSRPRHRRPCSTGATATCSNSATATAETTSRTRRTTPRLRSPPARRRRSRVPSRPSACRASWVT